MVIVITGGSSGIGHAAALAFARRGDEVVIVARGAEALARVADEIGQAGGRALAITADVANFDDVMRVVRETIDAFGRIDVWINNASVAEWGTVETYDVDTIGRVIAVDLLGTIYGCKAVLPHFRQRGGGVIINVGSALSDRAAPLLSTYSAAKAGVRGFTDALRMELAADGSNIDVVLVLPASINTPFYSNGRSRIGARPHPISVIYPPEAVANAIVSASERPRRDVHVGGMAKLLSLGQRISPAAMDAYMLGIGRLIEQQFSDRPDRGESNLFASPQDSRIDGDFTSETRRRAAHSPWFAAMAVGATTIALLMLARRR